jgi:hypothetical protein
MVMGLAKRGADAKAAVTEAGGGEIAWEARESIALPGSKRVMHRQYFEMVVSR